MHKMLRITTMAGAIIMLSACVSDGNVNVTNQYMDRFPIGSQARLDHHPASGYFYDRYVFRRTFFGDSINVPADELNAWRTRLADIGYEIREEDGQMYWRIHIFPHDIPQATIDSWPAWLQLGVSVTPGTGNRAEHFTLVARLPEDRKPVDGRITTGWAGAPFPDPTEGRREAVKLLAGMKSGQIGQGRRIKRGDVIVDITNPKLTADVSKVYKYGIFDGTEDDVRLAMRDWVGQETTDAQLYRAERVRYDELRQEWKAMSLTGQRRSMCGRLDFITWRVDRSGKRQEVAPAGIMREFEENERRFQSHKACVAAFIESYDFDSLAPKATRIRREEEELWPRTHLTENQRMRGEISAGALFREQDKYFKALDERYDRMEAGFAARYDAAMRDESAARRRAQQARRNEAASAAALAAALSPKVPVPSAGGGFDARGMMDNAQAVADGTADVSSLWKRDGTIATTRAQDVPAGVGSPTVSRRQIADGSTDRAGTSEARRSAPATEGRGMRPEPVTPQIYWVRYVVENAVLAQDGNPRAAVFPGPGVVGRTVPGTRLTPDIWERPVDFVVSDGTCRDGAVDAQRVQIHTAQFHKPTAQQIAALDQAAGRNPLISAAPSAGRLDDLTSRIGNNYKGRPVQRADRGGLFKLQEVCGEMRWKTFDGGTVYTW